MKLCAPTYYKNFICIAGRCEHSCCIGWEIDIDKSTLSRYKKLKGGYAERIIDSISFEGTAHFTLCEHDRCPHLDGDGLCKIILNVGEDYLCDICREHPRFYNYTDVCEVGLGMSCREAARVILSSPNYYIREEIGETDATDELCGFNGRLERERVYAILRDGTLDYQARIEKIRADYRIEMLEYGEAVETIGKLEYLDEAHKELFLNYSPDARATDSEEYLERALAYFIYRHCTEAYDEEDFRAGLAFCLFCERLLSSLILSQGAKTLDDIAVLASIISEEIEYSEDNTERLTY